MKTRQTFHFGPGASNKLIEWLVNNTIFLHGLAQQLKPRKKETLAQSWPRSRECLNTRKSRNVNIVDRVLTTERRIISRVAMVCAQVWRNRHLTSRGVFVSQNSITFCPCPSTTHQPLVCSHCSITADQLLVRYVRVDASMRFTSYNVYSDDWLLPRMKMCS